MMRGMVWFLAGACCAGGVALVQGGLVALNRGTAYSAALGEPVTVVCTDAQGRPIASRPPPDTRIGISYAGGVAGVAVTLTCR